MFMGQQSDPREVICLIFGTHSKFTEELRLKHVMFLLQPSSSPLTSLGRLSQEKELYKWKDFHL